ncbi:hypothetical protein AGRA3207_004573 [Actinomadura graeca]|uniref:Uncharacterized protein n=1 Tax=Actinomadura graeca TaxID=2750812 RepID=A0ABX8QX46_9ACTN|nr:hypothetical protein [Actinomadura graeca]QXJ23425.1 hypothetical protein AGRA3207_004573 [Actinomadura graeca]
MPLFRRKPKTSPPPAAAHKERETGRTSPITMVKRIFQPPPAPENLENTHHETDYTHQFQTPARDDVFEFIVTVQLEWCAKGERSLSELSADIAAERDGTHNRVRAIARDASRKHSPFNASEAEREINEALQREFETIVHSCEDVEVTCTPSVHVVMSEEVRASRQELGHSLLKIEANAEAHKLQLKKWAELRDLWLVFLKEKSDDHAVRFAVELAEKPANIAGVMDLMRTERREDAERLLRIVDSVINAQQTANVYDLVVSSETVLRKTLEMMGLDVPAETVFESLADGFN